MIQRHQRVGLGVGCRATDEPWTSNLPPTPVVSPHLGCRGRCGPVTAGSTPWRRGPRDCGSAWSTPERLARPSRIARIASTVSTPCSRGLTIPNRESNAAKNFSGIFSQMPIVRSPCTLECPRTGHSPAPGLPIMPRISSTLVISENHDRARQARRRSPPHPVDFQTVLQRRDHGLHACGLVPGPGHGHRVLVLAGVDVSVGWRRVPICPP